MEEKLLTAKELKRGHYYIPVGYKYVEVTHDQYLVYERCACKERNDEWRATKRQVSFEDLFASKYPLTVNAEDAAIHNIELEAMRKAISELNDSDRQLIEELFFNELSEREYGNRINVSNNTIHPRKIRILNSLRKKIENF